MPLLPFLATAATWLGRIGLAVFAINEVAKLTGAQKEQMQQSSDNAAKEGISATEQKKLVAATTFDQVEQDGKDPDDFWSGLTPDQKAELQFSPQTLRNDMQRTKFLGLSAALLFGASLFAAGTAAVRGIPIGLRTLAQLAEARASKATALQLLTIIEEGKIAGINKVWVPGLIATIAAAAGWLTNGMVGNLNDATLWGRIFLGQAADDFEKAAKQRAIGAGSGTGQTGGGFISTVTTTKTAKPKMFLGVVHSGRVVDTPDFVRHVDDKIESDADLAQDVQINLTRWLATIGDRMAYEIQVKYQPFDEFNVRRDGTWMMLALYYSGKGGKRIFVDEIPLGPFDPVVYYPTSQISESIRKAANDALQPEILKPTFSSTGVLSTVTKEGDSISLFPSAPAAAASAVAQAVQKLNYYPREYYYYNQAPIDQYFYREGGKVHISPTLGDFPTPGAHQAAGNAGAQWAEGIKALERAGVPVSTFKGETFVFEIDGRQAERVHHATFQDFFGPPGGSATAGSTAMAQSAATAPATLPQPQLVPSGVFAPPPAYLERDVTSGNTRQVNTPGSSLNVRAMPSTSAPIVAKLPHGGHVQLVLLATPVQAESYTWRLVTTAGTQGWVAEQFLV